MTDELDQAMERAARRRKIFMDEGLSERDAWSLSEAMFERDKDPSDDRRVCFECKLLENNKYCNGYKDHQGRPVPQLRFILQRCPKFELRGKK